MNKLFNKIAGSIVGIAMAIGVGVAVGSQRGDVRSVKAAEEVYKSVTFSQANCTNTTGGYTATAKFSDDIDVSCANFNTNNSSWNYIKCGRKGSASIGTIITDSAIDQGISKVAITVSAITAGSVNSIKLYSGNDGSSWTEVGSFAKATGTQDATINSPAANKYYKVEFDCASGSANGLVTLTKIEYYRTVSAEPSVSIADPNLSKLPAKYAVSTQLTASASDFAGVVTYTWSISSGSSYVDISGNGANCIVTSKSSNNSEGTATIQVSASDGATTKTATKSISIVSAYDIPGAKSAIDSQTTISGAYVVGKISQIDSYNSKYNSLTYWISNDGTTSNQLEAYSGKGLNGADFTATTDIEVGADVVIYGNLKKFNSIYEFDTNNYQVYYSAPVITTTYTITFNMNGGDGTETSKTVGEGLTFVFPSAGSKADNLFIGWSNDGGTTYHQEGDTSGAINADDTYVAYWQTKGSETTPYSVAEAKAAIDSGVGIKAAHVAGKISEVTSFDSQHKSITYWISDDGATTNQLQVYSGKGLNGADFAAKEDVETGASVVVCGNLKKHNEDYEFDYNNYLVSYSAPAPVLTPSITITNPDFSMKVGDVDVALAATTENAGESPVITWTSSNTSSATIINDDGTYKVHAVAAGNSTITASITVDSTNYTDTITVTVGAAPIVIDADGTYTKVTDVSTLATNDVVLITSLSGEKAMSATQGSNNRAAVDTGISNDEIIISGSTTMQAFLLEKNNVNSEDVYSFNTGDGYIYAASSRSNYLRTEPELDDNGRFTISITDGAATITATGTNSRNTIKYNSSSSIFSCYSSGQALVSIFKKGSTPVDPTKVLSVTLDKSSASIGVEETVTLSATIAPDTATTKTATWLTSDTSVATVSNGVVEGKGAGSAVITAFADENGNGQLDSNEKFDTCVITVIAASTGEWVEAPITSLTSSDIFVIVGNNGSNYAMSNNNGTGSAPAAVAVTVADGKITSAVPDSLKWNVTASSGSYVFAPNGDDENTLYCTASNNGVRVGTSENTAFTVDSESGYLVNTATGRYVGVYNSQDWRCYTSINSNIEGQTFAFYKYVVSYTASDFADEFLETLSTGSSHVCNAQGNTNLSSLKAEWKILAGKWTNVSDKTTITGVQPSESGTKYQQTLALYKYIAEKYNTQLQDSELTNYNFMGIEGLTPRSNSRIGIFGSTPEQTNNIMIIAIISAISVTAIGGYFFLRKKKEK